ncbi:unnamed protein product [Allacma fusca]|uniref:Tryptophan 5-hydroxylase 2 n=1 Tax=Allacma fusca TaxID=39272 RepID=A0A8J2PPV5_9HEXA|nr:unnamed protein product [Allacma fusca]
MSSWEYSPEVLGIPYLIQVAPADGESEDASKNTSNHNCVVFSLKNQVGGLARALKVFEDNGVNVIHIESRKSKRRPSEYEIMVDVDCDNRLMDDIMKTLASEVAAINLTSFDQGQKFPHPHVGALSSTSSFGL